MGAIAILVGACTGFVTTLFGAVWVAFAALVLLPVFTVVTFGADAWSTGLPAAGTLLAPGLALGVDVVELLACGALAGAVALLALMLAGAACVPAGAGLLGAGLLAAGLAVLAEFAGAFAALAGRTELLLEACPCAAPACAPLCCCGVALNLSLIFWMNCGVCPQAVPASMMVRSSPAVLFISLPYPSPARWQAAPGHD